MFYFAERERERERMISFKEKFIEKKIVNKLDDIG